MLTLYHAAPSRSSRILTLIDEMGIGDKVTIKRVTIPRRDGTGARDPSNPHPEGKVPCLDHDGTLISETGAIMLYLLELFPSDLAPKIGDPKRGEFLTWMYWYGSVMEPVIVFAALEMEHPGLASTFRDHAAAISRIHAALEYGPWLLGDHYSAADLLVYSPYAWFAEMLPDDPLITDWVARCAARPAHLRTKSLDAA
ncbi:glutathione S-transferase family protein [Pseudorhodobacter sp. W20_MBD10_FR17]|uniref:glutathione S-transferase family protein n=1 Tax=Pseudorhodobacter sp. W20_MBD10_FR17 TaxID=3240266 RepID=UPI003F99D75E